jgi:hypothetical protein
MLYCKRRIARLSLSLYSRPTFLYMGLSPKDDLRIIDHVANIFHVSGEVVVS